MPIGRGRFEGGGVGRRIHLMMGIQGIRAPGIPSHRGPDKSNSILVHSVTR